ncbi:unnamed protein product, partial [Ectocarpus sp. 12 AP-2014]
LPYLQGLLNVGGVMVVPFREELIRMEVCREAMVSLVPLRVPPLLPRNRVERAHGER